MSRGKVTIIILAFIVLVSVLIGTRLLSVLPGKKNFQSMHVEVVKNKQLMETNKASNYEDKGGSANNKPELSKPSSELSKPDSKLHKPPENSIASVNKQEKQDTAKQKTVASVQQPDGTKKGKEDRAIQLPIPAPLPIKPELVESKAEAVTGRKVEIKDLIKAGEIIIQKLSPNEIRFLFGTAKDDLFVNSSVEELEKIRKILFSKLSDEEIAVIREIGQKYGKEMKILDPNISVAEEKERKEKARDQK